MIQSTVFALQPPKSKLWKMKKIARDSSFYTCLSEMIISWSTVPEIRSKTDRIFCNLGSIFALLTSPSPNYHKNQNLEKQNQKNCLEILSFYTYMCAINEDHMIYGSEI